MERDRWKEQRQGSKTSAQMRLLDVELSQFDLNLEFKNVIRNQTKENNLEHRLCTPTLPKLWSM